MYRVCDATVPLQQTQSDTLADDFDQLTRHLHLKEHQHTSTGTRHLSLLRQHSKS